MTTYTLSISHNATGSVNDALLKLRGQSVTRVSFELPDIGKVSVVKLGTRFAVLHESGSMQIFESTYFDVNLENRVRDHISKLKKT